MVAIFPQCPCHALLCTTKEALVPQNILGLSLSVLLALSSCHLLRFFSLIPMSSSAFHLLWFICLSFSLVSLTCFFHPSCFLLSHYCSYFSLFCFLHLLYGFWCFLTCLSVSYCLLCCINLSCSFFHLLICWIYLFVLCTLSSPHLLTLLLCSLSAKTTWQQSSALLHENSN